MPPPGGFPKFDWLGSGFPRRGLYGWQALAAVLGFSSFALVYGALGLQNRV